MNTVDKYAYKLRMRGVLSELFDDQEKRKFISSTPEIVLDDIFYWLKDEGVTLIELLKEDGSFQERKDEFIRKELFFKDLTDE